jgi:hypothetical protein
MRVLAVVKLECGGAKRDDAGGLGMDARESELQWIAVSTILLEAHGRPYAGDIPEL